MLHFSANLSWLYTEASFSERFALAHADGFSAVECLFPYQHLDAHHLTEQLQQFKLDLVLFNTPPGDWPKGDRGLAARPERKNEFRQGFVDIALPYAIATRCPRLHIMSGCCYPHDDLLLLQNTLLDNLAWACHQAAVHGLAVTLEPINPVDMPHYFLTRQAQAHQLVEWVGATNLGVQMDLYHCHRVEGHILEQIHRWLPTGKVKHMQVAGFPGRHEPIPGDIDYPAAFQLIEALGYQGYIGCEYQPAQTTQAGLPLWWTPEKFSAASGKKD